MCGGGESCGFNVDKFKFIQIMYKIYYTLVNHLGRRKTSFLLDDRRIQTDSYLVEQSLTSTDP